MSTGDQRQTEDAGGGDAPFSVLQTTTLNLWSGEQERAFSNGDTTGAGDGISLLYSEATDSLLCVRSNVDDTGAYQVYTADAALENAPNLQCIRADDGDGGPLRAQFDPTSSTLIAANSRRLCFRRPSQQTYLLKTLLRARRDGEGDGDELQCLEMTVAEAIKLRDFLLKWKSHALPQDASAAESKTEKQQENFNTMLETLTEKLQTMNVDGDVDQASNKYETLVLTGSIAHLTSVFGLMLMLTKNVLRTEGHLLNLLAALRERVRLWSAQPYELMAPQVPGAEVPVTALDKTVMASEAARRITFEHWPHMHYRWALPNQMTEAGFYHQPNATGDDRVMCFTCNVCLVCWEPNDEPWSEHERHSSDCAFVAGAPTTNVPIGTTLAGVPCMPIRGVTPETSAVVLAFTANTTWTAVAEIGGRVTLANMERVLQSDSNTFSVDLHDAFIGMKTGYYKQQQTRRQHRVTWSDDHVESADTSESSAQQTEDQLNATAAATSTSAESATVTTTTGSSSSSQDVRVQSACVCAAPACVQQSETVSAAIASAVILAVGVRDQCLSGSAPPPADSSDHAADPLSSVNTTEFRPFLLVYKIEAGCTSLANSSGGGGGKPKQTNVDDDGKDEDNADARLLNDDDEDRHKATADEKIEDLEPAAAAASSDKPIELIDLTIDEQTPNGVGGSGQQQQQGGGGVYNQHVLPEVSEEELMSMSIDDDHWLMDEPGLGLVDHSLMPMGTWYSVDAASAAAAHMNSQPQPQTCSDLLQLSYDPLRASVLITQCFRMPPSCDTPGSSVAVVRTSLDGRLLYAAVNRPAGQCPLLLVYRLTFNNQMTSLNERVAKECPIGASDDSPSPIVSIDVLPAALVAVAGGGNGSNDVCLVDGMDTLLALTRDGRVHVLDLASAHTLCTVDAGAHALTAMHGSSFATVNAGSGELSVWQLDAEGQRAQSADQFEAMLKLMHADQALTWPEPESAVEPLSLAELYKRWLLTQTKSGTRATNTHSPNWTYSRLHGAASSAASPTALYVSAPACWQQLQQQQRQRKNPLHYLRDDRQTRSWCLVTDANSWREHVFDIVLPRGTQFSHIELAFTLHAGKTPSSAAEPSSVAGEPPLHNIQVCLLRRHERDEPPNTAQLAWYETLVAQHHQHHPQRQQQQQLSAAVQSALLKSSRVVGPMPIAQLCDVTARHATCQLGTPMLQSVAQRHFALFVFEQPRPEQPANQTVQQRESSELVADWLLSLHNTGGAASAFTPPTASSSATAAATVTTAPAGFGLPDPMTGRTVVRGCDHIDELSLTVWRVLTIPNQPTQRLDRLRLLTDRAERRAIVACLLEEAESRSSGEAEPSSSSSQQHWGAHMCLDVLHWCLDNETAMDASPARQASVLRACLLSGPGGLARLVARCFVQADRSVAHKTAALLARLLTVVVVHPSTTTTPASDDGCDRMSSYVGFVSALVDATCELLSDVRRLCAVQSAAALLWLLALVQRLCAFSTALVPAIGQLKQCVLRACLCAGRQLAERARRGDDDAPLRHALNTLGLSSQPLQLPLFDSALPLLALVTRPTSSSTTQGSAAQAYSYANAVTHGSVHHSQYALFSTDTAQDDVDWQELLHAHTAGTATSSNSKAGGASRTLSTKNRVLLSAQHLHGLLETEPLAFSLHHASETMRVENLDTGAFVTVEHSSSSSGTAQQSDSTTLTAPNSTANSTGKHTTVAAGSTGRAFDTLFE